MRWLKARWSSARAWIWSYTKWGFLILFAAGVIFVLWDIPKRQVRNLRQTDISGLDTKDRIQFEKDVIAAENSARVTLAQILGGFGLLVGLFFTYKSIRVTEEGKLTERFSKAVELLGSEKLDVRLGGIYALERIARDSQKDHWTVMEVLIAFVREQSKKDHKQWLEFLNDSGLTADVEIQRKKPLADIQAALTVIGRRKWADEEREHQCIDLSDSFLAGAELSDANLRKALLRQTNLLGAILNSVDFTEANLTLAELSSAHLYKAKFIKANFIMANCVFTHFTDAELTGAFLPGAKLVNADFFGTNLTGADLITSIGLTWEQISKAKIDKTTKLPPELEERRKAEQVKKAAAPNQ